PSVVKTSGKRGLHVLVPLAAGHTYDDAQSFALQVGETLAKQLPQITLERSLSSRKGRLYFDCMQNGYGKTVIAPYSLRGVPGAPPRVEGVTVDVTDQEYAPVPGIWELREAVASLYNRLYRRGLPSQYSAENVSISGGGRAALTRCAASLGHVNLGHFLPDYTAYEELLDIFRAFTSIPILLEGERGYAFTVEDLRREIQGRGLSALLLSNPCNPTGKLIQGDELRRWVGTARELECALLIDEFYSHYMCTVRPGEL